MNNQLFRRNPDRYIISDIMEIFNIKSLDDEEFYFTKQDILNADIIEKIIELKEKLLIYYIPCKAKIYLKDINEKRAITILRQFLKTHNYSLFSKEKYIQNIKYNTYTLISIDNNVNINKIKDRKIVINFE